RKPKSRPGHGRLEAWRLLRGAEACLMDQAKPTSAGHWGSARRGSMHFGQFNLMGYRTPGAKAHELYDNAVEQVKAAEANGFEIAWFAEHHFSNYCVCPSPLMMLARLAGETERIKLGSAVV